jgi:rhodanese-related sulfurtransferase
VKALLDGAAAPTVVDVRSIDEYAQGHVPGALSVPLPELASGAPTVLPSERSTPIVAVCKVGERSLYGMLLLKALGYQRVKSMRGGLNGWTAANLPVEKSD